MSDAPEKSALVNQTGAPKSIEPIRALESEGAQSKPLTPEEQMALYEKELKENDWGHQPC